MDKKLLALFGLKWNPFCNDVPTEALYPLPKVADFLWRIEHAHVREGGFALIHGEPGTGKSVALRLLAERLEPLPDLVVRALIHPQSNLADFYREMGEIFAVELKPHNRWNGFKDLRARWSHHMQSTRLRPVLLIDEAQELSPVLLRELRLMACAHFDSKLLLCVVFAGDVRFIEKLRLPELEPLGSRLGSRLAMLYASREELAQCLEHGLSAAGNPALMTKALQQVLCDHAAGNYRILHSMASQLLSAAAQHELPVLDEKLFLTVFAPPKSSPSTPTARAPKAR